MLARSEATPANEAPSTKFAKDQLKSIIERIERCEEEKKA
ncbi:GapR family DNA-binding domain-containing protein, partial [Pseudomonas proteolytica]